ncbi:hypothetical protein CHS0354_024559 [Potamilus streckersoni]|uniref:TIR domain-containing protein n=1 Tax=Potamilus streckersoni TaxID=2493646 RepID=A0AAE0WFR1_9BIVA|nr:hypothetical protein CHS0354_024559 [Potamilus streckersoni]
MTRELSSNEYVRPGHLDLHLNAALVHGQYQISRNIAIMDKILRDFRCNSCRSKEDLSYRCSTCKYVVTCCAILNLKGAFLYYQKQYLEACDQFNKVLEIDIDNQNALCNLHHVYKKLGDWEKADIYYKRFCRCSDDSKKKATYLGEQGFAILFDCHTKVNEHKRYGRAVKIFEECLQISKDLLRKTEDSDLELAELQWKLWYAQSLQRMINNCSNSSDEFNDCYTKGTKTLKDVTGAKIAERHSHITSIAYTYLGIFQSKKKTDGLVKLTEGLELNNPNQCFIRALGIQRNTEALIRYAIHLKYDNVCKAIEHIREALEIDKSEDGNWFAWSVSSDLHVCHVEKYKSGKDRELLDVAIQHGVIASSKNQTASLFVTLGKAYHYKARDTDNEKEKHELYLKALENFLHALQHLDGQKYELVHVAHGNCLLDMGQYRPALESFKRAVELGLDAENNISSNYVSMMKCYMMMLAVEKDIKEKESLLQTILYWLHVGDRNENLVKQSDPEKDNLSISDKNKSHQRDVFSKEIQNLGKNTDNKRKRPMSAISVDDFYINREREKNVDSALTDINNADIPDKRVIFSDKKRAENVDDIIIGDPVDCTYEGMNTKTFLDYQTMMMGKYPDIEKLVSVADKDDLNIHNDGKQRKECLCKNQKVEKKTCPENGEEKQSDWQTISTEALVAVIKFILQRKEEKQDKLIHLCLSSENLNAFPHNVLDILLHIVSFRKKTLIEDCLKHLNDQSYLSSSTDSQVEIGNQSTYHMDGMLRSWYVSEMSNCLGEIKCKRCQNSKCWKDDCGHGLNPVALYSAIAKYCPSFAKDIAVHLMTFNVKLAKLLLEAFQRGYISCTNHDIDEQIVEQHVMACISDLHYQACWMREERGSVYHESRHVQTYKVGLHPQYHPTLSRCLSLRVDCTSLLNQLVRISTFDEDSHMKLVKRQDKYDSIYLNYCKVQKKTTLPFNISVSQRPPKRRYPKYNYDFLIINSEKDNDWVKFELLPTLEGRYDLKGCFTKRDYMPGETIFKQFEEKVKESAKVLLVLSENFKKDELCYFQMYSALMKKLCIDRGKLIPLVKVSGDDKNIHEKVIPEEIQHIVCFSVDWFDWEMLVEAIEKE